MKRLTYISFALLFLVSCKKERFNISNLNGNFIHVMGHGGMGTSSTYPINSLESIGLCLANDADGTEIDVQMTNNGVLVAYHDSDLSHSTDIEGNINNMDWVDVQLANYTNIPYQNYDIISLNNIFGAIEDLDTKTFTLDVKLYPAGTDHLSYYDTFSDAIITLFDKFNLDDHVYIESQTIEFLQILQSKKPNYRLYIYPQTFDEGFTKAVENNLDGISISNEAITSEQVAQAHDAGIYVTIWGVKSKEENKDAVRKNPDMIQTDDVPYLVKLLE